jgi:WD40 repeat protein
LAARPSAADSLDRSAIPHNLLALVGDGDPRQAPAELVAVLAPANDGRADAQSQNIINSLAFSPDGKTLASGNRDGTIHLWDVKSGQWRKTLSGHQFRTNQVAFHPNGTVLASGGEDGKVRLWEVPSGHEIQELAHSLRTKEYQCVAFSPNGKWLVSSSLHDTVRLWDAETLQLLRALPTQEVWSIAFIPNSNTFVLGTEEGGLHFWDAERRELLGSIHDLRENAIRGVAVHPAGRWLAHGAHWSDGSVRVWDLRERHEVLTLKGHKNFVLSCVWRADGRMLASSGITEPQDEDRVVRLWDMSQLQTAAPEGTSPRCKVVPIPVGELHALALSPEGRHLAVGTKAGVVCILRLSRRGEVMRFPVVE